MRPAEWIAARRIRLREMALHEFGDEGFDIVGLVIDDYLSAERRQATLYREIESLRTRLQQYEPIGEPSVTPVRVFTGD